MCFPASGIYISIVSMHDDGGRQSLYPSDDDVPGDHDGVCSSIGDRSAGAEGYVMFKVLLSHVNADSRSYSCFLFAIIVMTRTTELKNGEQKERKKPGRVPTSCAECRR